MTQSSRIMELYSEFGPKIAVILTSKLRLPSDVVQDAVQDVFVGLLTHNETVGRLEQLNDQEAFRYLLVSVQRRAIRDVQRRWSRETELNAALLLSADESDWLGTLDLLKESLGHLDSPYQEVLSLLLLEQKNASEIADKLGRPINTIYQQMHRGLSKLRLLVRRRMSRK